MAESIEQVLHQIHLKTFEADLADIVDQAGFLINEIYQDDNRWEVRLKHDDSPVTAADLTAHVYLTQALGELMPAVPVLSEEGQTVSLAQRRAWGAYWLIDPLDGTQEFINRTGEFTVNVALMVDQKPVVGAIGVPLQQEVFVGNVTKGAFLWNDKGRLLPLRYQENERQAIVVASRSREGQKLDRFVESIEACQSIRRVGSALKFCAMAEGQVDIYPRFSKVCEWDVAAGHALLRSMGCEVYGLDPLGKGLRYNASEAMNQVYFLAGHPSQIEPVLSTWRDCLVNER